MGQGKPGNVNQLIVINAAQGHHVDLDRRKSHGLRESDAGPYLVKAVDAGNLPETLPLQGIKADIELSDAGGKEIFGIFYQHHTVGGQTDVLQIRDRGKPFDK